MDIDADPGVTRPGATEPISARRFHEAEGVEDWRVLADAEGNEVDVCTTMGRD